MQFFRTSLVDATLIEIQKIKDDRGYFARTMCQTEFAEHGLICDFVQANHSYNRSKGTLRGMHYQLAPHGEAKLVRCVRGAIYDVIIDLRQGSETYLLWAGFELTAESGRMLYVPPGFAHGFLTLVDDVDVIYQVSHTYTPAAEAGCRFDDPMFGIEWPSQIRVVSAKDERWPPYAERPEKDAQ